MRSEAEPSAFIGLPHDVDTKQKHLSASLPSYEAPQSSLGRGLEHTVPDLDSKQPSTPIPELDSRHASTPLSELESRPASTVVSELDSMSVTNAPRTPGRYSPSRIPLAVDIPHTGRPHTLVKEAGKTPGMEGSASGPGWDQWPEQTGSRVMSKVPATTHSLSQGPVVSQTPSRPLSPLRNEVHMLEVSQPGLGPQVQSRNGGKGEEQGTEASTSTPRGSRHQTVYVAYRPSSSQLPSLSQEPPPN